MHQERIMGSAGESPGWYWDQSASSSCSHFTITLCSYLNCSVFLRTYSSAPKPHSVIHVTCRDTGVICNSHWQTKRELSRYGQVLSSSPHQACKQPVLRAAPSPPHMDTDKKASWNSLRFYAEDHLTKYWAVIPLPAGQTSTGSSCSQTSSQSRLLRKLWFERSKCTSLCSRKKLNKKKNKAINYDSLVESEAKST